MLKHAWLGFYLALAATFFPQQMNAADPDAFQQASAIKLVSDALKAEVEGDILTRERLLIEAEKIDSKFAPHHWYRGQLIGGGGWLTVQQAIDQAQSNPLLAEYETYRAKHPSNVAGNWSVAIWCAQHGLAQRCRAHLMNILLQDADHVGARMALGHELVGNDWFTPEDKLKLAMKTERARAGFIKYQQQIDTLFKITQQSFPRNQQAKHDAAWKQLKEIKDPLAIPVMEAAAESYGYQVAQFVVDWMGDLDDKEAALALTRFALAHPLTEVQGRAIDKLRTRTFFDFMPELLDSLSSPIGFVTAPVFDRAGRFVGYRQAFAKEKMNEKLLWNFDTAVEQRNIVQNPYPRDSRLGRGPLIKNVVINGEQIGYDPRKPFGSRYTYRVTRSKREEELTTRNIEEANNAFCKAVTKMAAYTSIRTREAIAQLENRAINERNTKVAGLISRIADVEFHSFPNDVWDWWDKYNETDYQRSKLNRRRYNTARFVSEQLFNYKTDYTRKELPRDESIEYGSCFVAGTKVTTLRGLRPIEKIVAGDLVLSRSVESGELCFKPVIAATARAPAKSVVLRVNDEQLHCTTSHLLWVSGKGWTKAGEIEAGDLLHSAALPAVVMSREFGDVLPTHNLVVADHHTYFAGACRVLSHDVLPRMSTHNLVPGQSVYGD